jgi:hypothetical protein
MQEEIPRQQRPRFCMTKMQASPNRESETKAVSPSATAILTRVVSSRAGWSCAKNYASCDGL